MSKRYLGKGAAAAAFYSGGGGLALAEWLRSEMPVELDQGAEIAVQVQMALTYEQFESGDLAVDAFGALWQSIETASSSSGEAATIHQARLARILAGAKVVTLGAFNNFLLETGDDLLLESGDNLRVEDSGFHLIAGAVDDIEVGDVVTAAPLDGSIDRTEIYTVGSIIASLAVGPASAYLLSADG